MASRVHPPHQLRLSALNSYFSYQNSGFSTLCYQEMPKGTLFNIVLDIYISALKVVSPCPKWEQLLWNRGREADCSSLLKNRVANNSSVSSNLTDSSNYGVIVHILAKGINTLAAGNYVVRLIPPIWDAIALKKLSVILQNSGVKRWA